MSGYIWLNRTGVKEIDAIASALESAGNAYHSTEMWGDEGWGDDKRSQLDMIQEALNSAAAICAKAEKERFKYETALMLIAQGYPGSEGLAKAAITKPETVE